MLSFICMINYCVFYYIPAYNNYCIALAPLTKEIIIVCPDLLELRLPIFINDRTVLLYIET
jgi:hypothetical protein